MSRRNRFGLDNEDDEVCMEECSGCDGSGMEDCPMEWGGPCPSHCRACDGSQKITCQQCNGTGQVPA